eukprot:g20741.t1
MAAPLWRSARLARCVSSQRLRDLSKVYQLYLVTDDAFLDGQFYYKVEGAIRGGVTCLQLRLKNVSTAQYVQWAEKASHGERFGVASMQATWEEMEDAHVAIPDFDVEKGLSLFGVFDGHGGEAVAKLVSERLPRTLKNLEEYKAGNFKERVGDRQVH